MLESNYLKVLLREARTKKQRVGYQSNQKLLNPYQFSE